MVKDLGLLMIGPGRLQGYSLWLERLKRPLVRRVVFVIGWEPLVGDSGLPCACRCAHLQALVPQASPGRL